MKAAGRILLVLGIKRFRGGPKVSATAAGSPVPLSLRDVLKISGFKRLWLAQLVSILGDFLAVFGVINIITFKWHGTPLQVTKVMIAFIIPMAIVGPLAGVLHDAYHRPGGGGFAGVLAWVQFVLLSGQRQLFLLCCDALDDRNRAHGEREGCNRENRGFAEEGLHGWVEVRPDASCDFLRHDRDDDRDVCA